MRLLRQVSLGFGLLAALGVLAGRAALTPSVRRVVVAAQQQVPAPPPVDAEPGGRAVRVVRLGLGAVGVAVLLLGGWKVLHAVQPHSYVWLVVWLAGAIVLHDVLIAPVVSLLRAVAHARLRRLPEAALAFIKAAFVVGGVLVLVVVPELWAQHLGTLNPTVLPGRYGVRLIAVLVGLAGVTLAAVLLAVARSRSRMRTERG